MRNSLVLAAALLVAGEGVTAAAQAPSAGQDGRPEPLILQENDGEPLVRRSGPTGGWPYLIKLDPRQGGTEDFFVMAEVIAPGQVIPFHMHDNAEEILVFEEGGATVVVGDKKAVAGPRSIVFVPRNTWVAARNSSSRDIHLTAIFSRHGFETYMRAISAPPGQPLKPVMQEELTKLRTQGHATYWDTSKGPSPPGVPLP